MLFDFYGINKMFSGVGYRKVMRIRTDPKHWSTGTGYLFILYFSSKNCLAGFCSSVQKGQYNQYIAQILINPPRYIRGYLLEHTAESCVCIMHFRLILTHFLL